MNLKFASEVLEELDITEEEYISALQISDDQEFQLHLSWILLCQLTLAWEANIDIHPVFNYSKAITYMCNYLPKDEDESS